MMIEGIRTPARTHQIVWPEGAEFQVRTTPDGKHSYTAVLLGDRRIGQFHEKSRYRGIGELIHTASGFYFLKVGDALVVTESLPVFEEYTATSTLGDYTGRYVSVSYLAAAWDKGCAWQDLEARHVGQFEKNPWKKKHNATVWRWSRRLELA